jgi:hypothetical protein
MQTLTQAVSYGFWLVANSLICQNVILFGGGLTIVLWHGLFWQKNIFGRRFAQ